MVQHVSKMNLASFRSKGSPLERWATTAFYMRKQYGKAKALKWIIEEVPEQFMKQIRDAL